MAAIHDSHHNKRRLEGLFAHGTQASAAQWLAFVRGSRALRQFQTGRARVEPDTGAVSHGIDSLEHWLDVELFERKAHGIILTTAGRQFLPYVSEALSTIATGTLRLPSRRFEERLAISSFSLFAYKVLLPRLHKFQRCIRT
jgi:LysR family transcriptional regulator, glycine cleavage system transcriptional activator